MTLSAPLLARRRKTLHLAPWTFTTGSWTSPFGCGSLRSNHIRLCVQTASSSLSPTSIIGTNSRVCALLASQHSQSELTLLQHSPAMVLSPSTGSAVRQPIVISSASSRAVFDTYELLEHILFQLGPNDFGRVRHVSKTWRRIISESLKLRRLFCLTPLRVTDFEPFHELPAYDIYWILIVEFDVQNKPCYSFELDFSFNPILTVCKIDRSGHRGGDEWRIMLPKTISTDGEQLQVGEYITSPPISTICIFFNPGRGAASSCTLRIDTGITIGDVLRAQQGLLTTEAKHCPYKLGKGHDGCYALVTRKVDASDILLID